MKGLGFRVANLEILYRLFAGLLSGLLCLRSGLIARVLGRFGLWLVLFNGVSDLGLSELWSLFGYPKYTVPYYNRAPKRDHNFDNHPSHFLLGLLAGIRFGFGRDQGTAMPQIPMDSVEITVFADAFPTRASAVAVLTVVCRANSVSCKMAPPPSKSSGRSSKNCP